ncbi:MAG: riboflavin kinase/FMN adenylyltransferase [Saprospiraceae bacterium]
MQIHRGLEQLPKFRNAVLTIGSYDGVHHGHRMIIKRLIEVAKKVDGDSIIITFDPHPRKVVFPNDDSLRLLTTTEEKIALLEKTGLDHLVIIPFTIAFSQINPYEYVDKFLITKCQVKHLIIGYDHKFGLSRRGDINLLRLYEEKDAFSVEEISKQDIDNLHVSSSQIRNYILDGDLEKANRLLVSPFRLSGKVEKGHQLAGPMGYPTANITIQDRDKILPAYGSYAAEVECEGITYQGMMYIGRSATLKNDSKIIVETNLFAKLEHSLYDKEIIIQPLSFIRKDEKFTSKEELIFNIKGDKIACLQYFGQRAQNCLVTTAILNYNGSRFLKQFLPFHLNSSFESQELLVIDNASTDNSTEILKSEFSDVQINHIEKNLGFAGGYNEGLTNVYTKYIAIVNSDIEVSKNWLEPLVEALEADPELVAVQPKILSFAHKSKFEYAGAAGGMLDKLGYPYCRGRIMSTIEEDKKQYNNDLSVDWTSGAAMLVRSEVFKEIGGFDTAFFAHMEEIDLCWRLRKAGLKLACIPASEVYHVGGGTLNYQSSRKAFLNMRNNYHMILKNMPLAQLLYKIPIRLILDLLFVIKTLLSGQVGVALSSGRGIFSGLMNVFTIKKEKRIDQFYRNRYGRAENNPNGYRLGILPLVYYFMNKKKFHQLKRHE